MQLQTEHNGEGIDDIRAGQDRILDRLDQPTGTAMVLRQAIGPKGENVRWLVLGAVMLAVIAASVYGAAVTLTAGDVSIITGQGP
jgi:hypothetical protein